MELYDPKKIESRWQKEWGKNGVYKTRDDSELPKQYILDMFPYPSGEGLHVGHPRGYIATDIYSRMKRMQGANVLHPMGWDAFGLPAENFAIQNKIHPREAVEKNIARFKKQLSLMGFDYDWSREINTTDPEYYKWTQWIFLQMYKKGLAYESNEPINWCPSCQTGLANEDVESNGTCERCGTKVEKKKIRQWVLKITDYADRLLADLDKLPNWPAGVKEAQRNWIGRSEGLVFKHKVKNSNLEFDTFSAHFESSYADTFIAIAPDHPFLDDLIKGMDNEEDLRTKFKKITDRRLENNYKEKEVEGVFTGRYAIDPLTGGNMPIWVASFAIFDYGTGIVRCSAFDERDVAFAQKYGIALKDENLRESAKHFIDLGVAKKKVMYRLRDWVFSRQRYWGEPIPIIHCEKCGVMPVPEEDLPVKLPEVKNYQPTGTGESPLADISEWVNVSCPKCGGSAKRETNTMPQWAGSSWYYLRYIDPHNNETFVDKKKEKYWMTASPVKGREGSQRDSAFNGVDVYVGGDHATRHLMYARFWHKFLFDIGMITTEEPFPRLEFLGFILAPDGRKMSKRWKNVINPDEMIERFGADAFRLYEMFIGPFENTVPWNIDGLVGTRRFVEKVWRLKDKVTPLRLASEGEQGGRLKGEGKSETILNKTIKKVSEDIEQFKFNTAVSAFMICVNKLDKAENLNKEAYEKFLKILAPFAPHISEELWHELGHKTSIHQEKWPEYDPQALLDSIVKIVIQVNGKPRGSIEVKPGALENEVRALSFKEPNIKKWLENKEPQKTIYVPGRVINFLT